jgi:glucokinase
MLLAADIGGTKALLGVFQVGGARPRSVVVREYATLDSAGLDDLVGTFLEDVGPAEIDAIGIGVAGPVEGLVARLTNVPWVADGTAVARRFGRARVRLVNDLEAMAHSVAVLEPGELAVLQKGAAAPGGNAALIAAGTGLGEALLHRVNGQLVPSASEGGHADFAARTPRELALVDRLLRVHGRVDNERVISGPGLVNLFRFTHQAEDVRTACRVLGSAVDPADLPAAISAAALGARCERCAEALDMFIEAYGAEAGNLGLRSVATAGVYVGGGIAPKILPALEGGRFIRAFCDKAPLVDWLRATPVSVILNPAAGLIGAAVCAERLTAR